MVRRLILAKLDELGLNMSEASVKIGRNHAYLQQFLKRGIPVELRERDRVRLAELLKVSEDELRGPSSTPLPKRSYEKKVEQSKNLFEVAGNQAHTPPANERSPVQIVSGKELFGTSDLPVFGTAAGGHDGALIVSDTAVDWMVRPASLLRVQDGYGVIVSDDSMSPEHKPGSIALFNPHLPPRAGESCAFRDKTVGGHVIIREYRGQTETTWKVHQHNPPKDLTLKKSEWRFAHRTVGNLSS